MPQYAVVLNQNIWQSKRHQYCSPRVKIWRTLMCGPITNAFFASHDYSRRFSGANIRIFFNTNAFQDKVHYIDKRKSMDYRVDFFLKDAKYQVIWPVSYIIIFIFIKKSTIKNISKPTK